MTNYPKKYQVSAVSGELIHGNEWTVYTPVWFIEEDSKMHWTSNQRWKHEDLEKISDWDREYLYFLEPENYIPINEGESLYFMGPGIYTVLTHLVEGKIFNFSLNAWKPALKGYYAATLTPAAFTAFSKELSVKIWEVMTQRVEDFMELEVKPDDLYRAYRSFAYYAKLDKHLLAAQEGAFFKAFKDDTAYKITTYVSVDIEHLYADKEEYTNAVQNVLEQMEPHPDMNRSELV